MANHYTNDSVIITSTSYSNGANAGYTAFAQQHDLILMTVILLSSNAIKVVLQSGVTHVTIH